MSPAYVARQTVRAVRRRRRELFLPRTARWVLWLAELFPAHSMPGCRGIRIMSPTEPTHHDPLREPFLEILYDIGSCLAVNKPAGVLTQAPPGIDSMEVRVRRCWQAQADKSYHLYVGVPHRLDRPVSGVLVFTRNVRATQRLARQFEQRTLEKVYLALVEGRPPAAGEWCDPLRKVPGRARVEVVTTDHRDAKEARLAYQVLAEIGDASLVAVQLMTGRTHQIRVQFAHRGFPILGDDQYGSCRPFGQPWNDARNGRSPCTRTGCDSNTPHYLRRWMCGHPWEPTGLPCVTGST